MKNKTTKKITKTTLVVKALNEIKMKQIIAGGGGGVEGQGTGTFIK